MEPAAAREQAGWAALGVVLYVVTLLVVRYSRDLERYRYLLLLLAGILLVAPLFFSPINGARLWVHFGGLEFQPIEFSKILLCIFFASYFAENKEMLSIPTARLGNRLILDPRPLIPLLVAWGAAMAVIGLEGDIGFAALLFTLFIAMLWITTGRFGYLVLGALLFAGGAYISAHYFGQVHTRVDEWLNPWATTTNINAGGAQMAGAVRVRHRGRRWHRARLRPPGRQHPVSHDRHDLRRHRDRDGPRRIGGDRRRLRPPHRLGLPHRPGGAFGLLAAAGDRPDADHRLPGLLHHGGRGATAPLHGDHAPLRRLRRVVAAGQFVLIALLLRISDEGAKTQAQMLAAGSAGTPGERPMVPAG